MKRLIISTLLLLSAITALCQGSEGIGVVSLPGRTLTNSLPKLTTSGQVDGNVVISINVTRNGRVLEARPDSEGSSITNESVLNMVESAALRAHFNTNTSAPSLQPGTITYTFVSSGLANNDESVHKFVGVPIDGDADFMYGALKEKGFKKNYADEIVGMFNGEPVEVRLSTNHRLVDVVKVLYPRCGEENDARIKYNLLLSRFNRNAKYVCINQRSELLANEDIHTNLKKNTKYYDAIYFFLHPEIDSKQWVSDFRQEYKKRFDKTLEGLSYEEMEEALFCLPLNVSAAVSGVVWFTITTPYNIIINYVNFKNRPRGEDL